MALMERLAWASATRVLRVSTSSSSGSAMVCANITSLVRILLMFLTSHTYPWCHYRRSIPWQIQHHPDLCRCLLGRFADTVGKCSARIDRRWTCSWWLHRGNHYHWFRYWWHQVQHRTFDRRSIPAPHDGYQDPEVRRTHHHRSRHYIPEDLHGLLLVHQPWLSFVDCHSLHGEREGLLDCFPFMFLRFQYRHSRVDSEAQVIRRPSSSRSNHYRCFQGYWHHDQVTQHQRTKADVACSEQCH